MPFRNPPSRTTADMNDIEYTPPTHTPPTSASSAVLGNQRATARVAVEVDHQTPVTRSQQYPSR